MNSRPRVSAPAAARIGSLCYLAWGLFHLHVAYDIYQLGLPLAGLAQGRMYQLAAHMLSIATVVIVVSIFADWRNSSVGYWLNLSVAGGADGVWVLVVVLPGYVSVSRGLMPPTLFVAAAIATTIARRIEWRPRLHGKHEEATMRSLIDRNRAD